MNAPALALTEHLRALLAQGGAFTAQQLQAATGKSQPSISLALNKMGAEVCEMGERGEKSADWLSPPGQLRWFVQTLRPQGFLGRQLTRLRPDFPADPDTWRTPSPRRYLFGQYIGNTDMHFGNLSFFVDDVLLPALTPGGCTAASWTPSPLQPQPQPAGYAALDFKVRAWDITYWERAASLPALSAALRAASGANAQLLQRGFRG